MTASLRLTNTEVFPPGTVVKAYQARGGAHPFPGPLPPALGMAPPAAAPIIAEGTMGSESVTLTGLEFGTFYVIGGQVASVWRWVEARTEPTTETTSGGISQAEGDARYLQLTAAEALYERILGRTGEPVTISSGTYNLPEGSERSQSTLVLAHDVVIKPPPAQRGMTYDVLVKQDVTGSRKWSFSGVKWGRGIVPEVGVSPVGAAKEEVLVALRCFDASVGWLAFIVDEAFA